MQTNNKKMNRVSLRIRENCPEHQVFLRRCNNRDRKKYRSMTDYMAAAVSALEDESYIVIRMKIATITEEELKAVNLLLQHKE